LLTISMSLCKLAKSAAKIEGAIKLLISLWLCCDFIW
jgi:hypothetical protein